MFSQCKDLTPSMGLYWLTGGNAPTGTVPLHTASAEVMQLVHISHIYDI